MDKDLVIKDCDPTFTKMVYDLHAAYKQRMKIGIEIHFSGKDGDFKYFPKSIESKKFFQLINEKEEKENNK